MTEARKRRTAPRAGAGSSPWAVRHRRPRDHDLKREAVVRAAALAFNERGYHNTSLDDVAAALGVTKPTVYYYVANKEQLLFECFREGLQRIREAVRESERSDRPARERLAAVVRGYAQAMASEYGWCLVRAHEHDLGPELGREINALKSEIDLGLRRLLREGVADGSLGPCDPKLTAFAMAGALNWIAHWYRTDQPMSADQVASAFLAFFEQGLLPRPSGPAVRHD
ncbi:MAG: TetR/AcrR family transcriptional regulator [Steroidobacteraceae bacterium]